MPVFRLDDHIQFPRPELAEENGLLAIGGDLRPQRLLHAYSLGIFPWYSDGDPILWWFTSPRLVLFPEDFTVSKRLQRYARTTEYQIKINSSFDQVIEQCAKIRTETGEDTWITKEMKAAYSQLHHLGYAHSFECWQGDSLVGGLYGIALDKVFFGESMFSRIKCGSQFALIALIDYLKTSELKMVDCQMTTEHLLRFGAQEISGDEFRQKLRLYIKSFKPHLRWIHERKESN